MFSMLPFVPRRTEHESFKYFYMSFLLSYTMRDKSSLLSALTLELL